MKKHYLKRKVAFLLLFLGAPFITGTQAFASTTDHQDNKTNLVLPVHIAKVKKAAIAMSYPPRNSFLGRSGIVKFAPSNLSGYRLIEKHVNVCVLGSSCTTQDITGQTFFSNGAVSVRSLDDYTFFVHTDENGSYFIAGNYYFSNTLTEGQSCGLNSSECVAVPFYGAFSMLTNRDAWAPISVLPMTNEILSLLQTNASMGLDCSFSLVQSKKGVYCAVNPWAQLFLSYTPSPDDEVRLSLSGNIKIQIIEFYGPQLKKTVRLTKVVPMWSYNRFFTMPNKLWTTYSERPYMVAIGPYNLANSPSHTGFAWLNDRVEVGYATFPQ